LLEVDLQATEDMLSQKNATKHRRRNWDAEALYLFDLICKKAGYKSSEKFRLKPALTNPYSPKNTVQPQVFCP